MFKTTGTIDRKFYNKYTSVLYSGVIKSFIFAFLIAFITIILIDPMFDVILLAEELVAFVAIAAFAIYYISWCKKIIFAQLTEAAGSAYYLCESYFEEDAAIFKNLALNSTSKIKYNNFVKFTKTDLVWFLFTKAGLFVPVFVDTLSADEKESLLKFLKEHLANVKKF